MVLSSAFWFQRKCIETKILKLCFQRLSERIFAHDRNYFYMSFFLRKKLTVKKRLNWKDIWDLKILEIIIFIPWVMLEMHNFKPYWNFISIKNIHYFAPMFVINVYLFFSCLLAKSLFFYQKYSLTNEAISLNTYRVRVVLWSKSSQFQEKYKARVSIYYDSDGWKFFFIVFSVNKESVLIFTNPLCFNFGFSYSWDYSKLSATIF